ncbi:MAG: amidohydrolase family protein [Pirellulaceae bacterium]|nr:amidohydrolase family protein [Planctomycetales bacterium]
MRIDSHHHLWQYDPQQYGWIGDNMSVLKHDFGPAQLQDVLQQVGIDGAVAVQARQSLEETEWLVGLAEQHPFMLGVVGWVPLVADDLYDTLQRLTQSPWLKGVRHVVQDEPDDEFILRDDINRGVGLLHEFGLVYDILIFAKHLEHTIRFVDRHPGQFFVLDHIAKPTIGSAQFDDGWARSLKELARRDNVACKFSGVATEVRDPEWSLDMLRPYWDVTLEAFGAHRLMFGSDWPVCLLRTGYAAWFEVVQQFAQALSTGERTALFGANAAKAYRLTQAAA